jgi:hypothetical protein
MSTITRVAVNGTDLPDTQVVYALRIAHGRSTITDGPAASTCELVLTGDPLPAVQLSDLLEIDAYSLPRFTGVVSDLRPAQDLATGRQLLEVTATGPLADLALDPITTDTWPQESSQDRAARILTTVGVDDYWASGTMEVLASDGQYSTALELLNTLATDTGAAVFDTPNGLIVFQDIHGRRQRYIPDTWATMTGTWADQSGTWAEQSSPAVNEPVTIPANVIAWQPSLEQHRGDIVNLVAVEYGSPKAVVVEQDTTSQTKHKVRAASITTNLALEADATTRAEQIITRLALPRYQLGNVSVLVHDADSTLRTQLMNMICGDRVIIAGLPAAYPVTDWLGVLEGWAETYSVDEFGNEYHMLGLALSDPRASFAALKWQDVTDTLTWADIPANRIWADITSNELLSA